MDQSRKESEDAVDTEKLYSKIGQLEMENDLLKKNLAINRPNQVWEIDITYIPMKHHGFM